MRTNDTEYKTRNTYLKKKYPVDSSKFFTAAFLSIKSFVRKKKKMKENIQFFRKRKL